MPCLVRNTFLPVGTEEEGCALPGRGRFSTCKLWVVLKLHDELINRNRTDRHPLYIGHVPDLERGALDERDLKKSVSSSGN